MRPRLLKALRIGITAVSLLVCGLLIVLWVRSYWREDGLNVWLAGAKMFLISSRDGVMSVNICTYPTSYELPGVWFFHSREVSDEWPEWFIDRPSWTYILSQSTFELASPHWFPITIFATIAALPWIKWRFSLRTLLIVVTLFALLFGAIAMLM